jgi:aryl-alcohol dehydrogenase-like predicted oxidoreductase
MRYRELAPGIQVSEIGFGNWTMTTGWWGEYTRAEALRLHRQAFEAGITFFDTSNAYAEGYAEEVLGEALAGVRDDVVIATKFGYDLDVTAGRRGQQERPHRTDIASVRRDLEDSLRRLGTDHVDFYQLHNPRTGHLDDDDLFAFLDEAVAGGKVRAYGVTLGPKIGWLEEGIHGMRTRRLAGMQMIYNLLEQDPGRELLACARETGTKMIVRVPHSSGMLEGNLTADYVFPKNDHRRHRPRSWLVEGVQKVATLDFLTTDRTLGQAALNWVLADTNVATTLPNIYGPEQIAEFAAASDLAPLSDEQLRRVEELHAGNFGVTPLADQVSKVNGGLPADAGRPA